MHRIFVVAAVLLTAMLAVPGEAAANFGSTDCAGTSSPRNCVSLANNRYHAVRFSQLGDVPGIADAIVWSLANNYDPTDLVAYRDDSDPYPDVIAYDSNYSTINFVGWAECPTGNTGTGGTHPLMWCRGQRLRFNSRFNDYDFATEVRRRRVACHELGHTVGLRHWNPQHGTTAGSCMYDPAANGVASLSAHEVTDHLNASY